MGAMQYDFDKGNMWALVHNPMRIYLPVIWGTPVLTMEEIGLARPICTHNHIDLGRERICFESIFVGLEA